jgi:hypothetical protein
VEEKGLHTLEGRSTNRKGQYAYRIGPTTSFLAKCYNEASLVISVKITWLQFSYVPDILIGNHQFG